MVVQGDRPPVAFLHGAWLSSFDFVTLMWSAALAEARALKQRLPWARLVMLSRAGHLPQATRPQSVLRVIGMSTPALRESSRGVPRSRR